MIVRDGRRQTHDYGPLAARVHGIGGAPVGHGIPIVSYATPRAPKAAVNRYSDVPRCGVVMPGWANKYGRSPDGGALCARTVGHRDSHRSAAALQADSERRRTNQPNGRPRR